MLEHPFDRIREGKMKIMKYGTLVVYMLLFLSTIISPATLFADQSLMPGTKQVFLLTGKGEEIAIGSVEVKIISGSDNYSYRLLVDHSEFNDYFLSMKEMKCLEGPELWCHLPYPYQHAKTVSNDDLAWLSHDLLFMFKKPSEFGAKFWNGIYYELKVEQGAIIGSARAVDLNLLAAPPDDLTIPPFNEYERHELDPNARWLPKLVIR